ncbi:hypothetical protein BBJ66_19460 [Rhizobium sp. RSm-3]|nr:hypothetical protein BBJ66_19460 [Rhizobium sp. RSm-3]
MAKIWPQSLKAELVSDMMPKSLSDFLKRVAIFQIRSLRFSSLFLRMSLPQNRCTLLRDML